MTDAKGLVAAKEIAGRDACEVKHASLMGWAEGYLCATAVRQGQFEEVLRRESSVREREAKVQALVEAAEEAERLLFIAARCGSKLWTAYQRREVSPRNEYDEWIVAVEGTTRELPAHQEDSAVDRARAGLCAALDAVKGTK